MRKDYGSAFITIASNLDSTQLVFCLGYLQVASLTKTEDYGGMVPMGWASVSYLLQLDTGSVSNPPSLDA